MTIIYFHGFGSVGESPKTEALRNEFGYEHLYAPNLPYDSEKLREGILDTIKRAAANEETPIVLVGTSLGGFYASYFSAITDCPCVIINPSTNAPHTMESRIGMPLKNYVTGEPIVISEEFVKGLYYMRETEQEHRSPSLVHLFVAKDDDLIDYKETVSSYPHRAFLAQYNDGGHRFEKHWPAVVGYIRQTFFNKEVK